MNIPSTSNGKNVSPTGCYAGLESVIMSKTDPDYVNNLSNIAELKSLDRNHSHRFEGVFVIRKIDSKTARNGSLYYLVELGDASGSFHTTAFSDSADFFFFEHATVGDFIRASGYTEYYQERFSPRLSTIDKLSEDERAQPAILERLVLCAPIPREELWAELLAITATVEPEALRLTVELGLEMLGEKFQTVPGGISMHHAYRSGLLEHTVRMLRAANALLPLYPEVNRGLTLAGIVLHDAGKVYEYTSEIGTQKTRKGILQGHVVLGYRVARGAAMKAKLPAALLERLEHIILSHQGQLEWGAAALAATPEAVFVSMIDNLDAKMGCVQHELRKAVDTDSEFSEYLPALGTRLLVQPVE